MKNGQPVIIYCSPPVSMIAFAEQLVCRAVVRVRQGAPRKGRAPCSFIGRVSQVSVASSLDNAKTVSHAQPCPRFLTHCRESRTGSIQTEVRLNLVCRERFCNCAKRELRQNSDQCHDRGS
ncbi:hypothetical protein FDR95_11405 [Rhizobiaceae bacterium LC148]|nr:hypothetical protein FDR95_11405 [Rhizobiaceae bacterium LC148]